MTTLQRCLTRDRWTSARRRAAAGSSGPTRARAHGLGEGATPEVLPAREPFRTLLRRLGLAEQAAGVASWSSSSSLCSSRSCQRYLPGGGWAWTGEIARFAMVWVTFVMSGYLMAHDGHIAIKVVDYFLPVRALGAVKLLGHALIAVTCAVARLRDRRLHDQRPRPGHRRPPRSRWRSSTRSSPSASPRPPSAPYSRSSCWTSRRSRTGEKAVA